MVIVKEFENYEETLIELLDDLKLGQLIQGRSQILLKPNAVDAKAFPITTHPELLRELVIYLRKITSAKLIVAEGCGTPSLTTIEVFQQLGYIDALANLNVEFVDLNEAELVSSEIKGLQVFPKYYLPQIALDSFIINLPVLKAHSLATVTLSLKNMMGFASPSKYQKGGYWRKSSFHDQMETSIIEMNLHRQADLNILDATVGMAEYHLGGAHCNPPVNKILASTNPAELDKLGAELLGFDWRDIPHVADYETVRSEFNGVN